MNNSVPCYESPNNQQRYCGKCYAHNSEQDQLLGSLYSILLLIVHLFFLIKLLRAKNRFAVKQRSPILIAFTIVLSFICSISFPITFVIHPQGRYNPNNFIENIMDDGDKWYAQIIQIRSLYAVLQSTIFWGILLRNIRIFIVFETNLNNKIVKFFFASDLGLMFILLLKLVAETTVISSLNQSYKLSIAYFNTRHKDDQNIADLFLTNYWMIKHCTQNFLLPLSVFMIRRVPQQFNLAKEAICISLFYYLQSFMMESLDNKCFYFMPLQEVSADLRNFLILVFIVIYPKYCMIDNLHHHLPTPIVLHNQKFLLINPFIRKWFIVFIETRKQQYKQQNAQIYEHYQYCNVYFSFLKQFELINAQQDQLISDSTKNRQQQRLQELFNKLVSNNSHCYPQYLVSQLRTQQIDAYIIQQFYEYCNQMITQYYHEFKRTKSFSHIQKQFEQNENSINRLELFGLINRMIAL